MQNLKPEVDSGVSLFFKVKVKVWSVESVYCSRNVVEGRVGETTCFLCSYSSRLAVERLPVTVLHREKTIYESGWRNLELILGA